MRVEAVHLRPSHCSVLLRWASRRSEVVQGGASTPLSAADIDLDVALAAAAANAPSSRQGGVHHPGPAGWPRVRPAATCQHCEQGAFCASAAGAAAAIAPQAGAATNQQRGHLGHILPP